MSSANILIVEPDVSIANGLKDILEGLDYKVVGVVSWGAESIKMIKQLRPAIVLMNIRLRGRSDGIATGSLIREEHDVPVVYMVDQDSRAHIRRAGATGSFGYIFRPFDDEQIYAAVETALTRHDLEKKMDESRQWLDATLKSIGDGVVATDRDGLIRFINPAAAKWTRPKLANAVGQTLGDAFSFFDALPPELVNLAASHAEAPNQHTGQGIVVRLNSRDQRIIPVEVKAATIKDSKGAVDGMVLVFRDIQQEQEARFEIQRQADRAQALLNAASKISGQLEAEQLLKTICAITNQTLKAAGTVVVLWDAANEVYRPMANDSEDPSFLADHGFQFEVQRDVMRALLPQKNPIIMIPDIRVIPDLPYKKTLKELKIKAIVIAALFQGDNLLGALLSVFKEGQNIPPQDEIALLRGLADQASSAIENAMLFEQVREGRESQRKLSKSLMNVQETERRHLARELHDHLGQILTGLQFMLENAKNQASSPQKPALDEIQNSVGDIIAQVREMSLNLRPSMLDDMGLVPTLKWHFERYTSQTGIKVISQMDKFAYRFPSEVETAIYRIIQESLTNVARYAQVKEVFVKLGLHGDTISVDVDDRGIGFDLRTGLEKRSTGLGGMRERANLIGGYLTVNSAPKRGTQILAVLPVKGAPLERRKNERIDPHR